MFKTAFYSNTFWLQFDENTTYGKAENSWLNVFGIRATHLVYPLFVSLYAWNVDLYTFIVRLMVKIQGTPVKLKSSIFLYSVSKVKNRSVFYFC